jgi:hypothetical protein
LAGCIVTAVTAVTAVRAVTAIAAECSFEQVASSIGTAASNRSATLAAQSEKIFDSMEALSQKAKIQTIPTVQRLADAEIEEFGSLKQRLVTVQLQMLIESGLKRDIVFLGKMLRVAEAVYGGAPLPLPEDSEYYLPSSVLVAIRQLRAQHEWASTEPPDMNECSIDVALQNLETDREHIVAKDMVSATQERDFIDDLENLKGLWKMALFKYQTSRNAVFETGGDPNAITSALNQKMKAPGKDADYLGMLGKIAQTIPSEHAKQLDEMAKFKRLLLGEQYWTR